jgi:hypothetical protein
MLVRCCDSALAPHGLGAARHVRVVARVCGYGCRASCTRTCTRPCPVSCVRVPVSGVVCTGARTRVARTGPAPVSHVQVSALASCVQATWLLVRGIPSRKRYRAHAHAPWAHLPASEILPTSALTPSLGYPCVHLRCYVRTLKLLVQCSILGVFISCKPHNASSFCMYML